MPRKCLLDMDGVLVDLHKGLCKFKGYKYPYDCSKFLGEWDLNKIFSTTSQKLWEGCEQQFWESLEPMSDAFVILRLVEEKFGVKNICLLSSPTHNLGCMPGKYKWILKYLPQYKNSFLFGIRKEFCSHTEAVLIDDRNENVDDFIEHGGTAILLPRPWNRHHVYSPIPFLQGALSLIKT